MFEKFLDPVFLEEYRTSKKYEKIRTQYKELYEKANIVPMPVTFSKLRMFSECGERYEFEEAYNQHLDKLVMCAYMAIIYGDEKYIREVDDCIYDVLSIYNWALSAHIPDLNEENYYELDLASTAHGATFAIIYKLLGDKIHPQLKKRIVTELRRRILDPFKAQAWHWEDRYNNWTSVCAGFTGITLMLMFPEEFDKLLPRFNENMRKYYEGFPDDGVCLEGPGYWGYGFVSFLAYALVLKDYTRGEIDYFKLPKTKKIAFFYQNTVLDKDVITSYGDCPMDVKTSAVLFHILKKEYGKDFYIPTESRLALPVSPLIHPLLYIEYYDPDLLEDSVPLGECYMENAGWYVKRTPYYAIGAKGGTNGESHNHNDVGSFVFSKNNKQVFIDMGGRPYTKDYFTSDRYKYLETSSRGHNVPIINGQYQANVRETRSYTSLENGVFRVDFRELYDIPQLKSLVREYRCEDSRVTIRDTFKIDGGGTFTERLVSFDKPQIIDGEILVGGVKVKFDKHLAKASYTEDIHHTTSKAEPPEMTVYCINIHTLFPEKSEFEFTIEA
ncbi:MAG: heparinase II/III family protein [Clostridia bacterium]|nr:heparinase II/III family protein [Clostridia bacterium]